MKFFLLILSLFVFKLSPGQDVISLNVDSLNHSYRKTQLVVRVGASVQKGYGVEFGLFLNTFYTKFPRNVWMSFLPYGSQGFFVSSEFVLRGLDNPVIAPKIGWEASIIGETHGGYYGMEFINYTDFKKYSPALMLKIGLPLKWFNIGYGYTMFFQKDLKSKIGKHRLILSYTINRKSEKKSKEIEAAWKEIREKRLQEEEEKQE